MIKIALAAFAAAGFATMAEAKVVKYTYTYAFHQLQQNFVGQAQNEAGGRFEYDIDYVVDTVSDPLSFDVLIDTDVINLSDAQLFWYGRSIAGLWTNLPGVGERTLYFDVDGVPVYWDLYVRSAGRTENYYPYADVVETTEYVGIERLSEAPFDLELPKGLDGYGTLTTYNLGAGGSWAIGDGPDQLPAPVPLPASALLLLGGFGALALTRRGGSRAG